MSTIPPVFPASYVLRAVSLIVPGAQRNVWLDEWQAEIAHAWTRGSGGGSAPTLLRLRLTFRAAMAVSDAMWLRKRHRRGAGWRWALQDSVRTLWRSPAFSLAVIGTLALGMGSATAVFSVVDGLMLRPLPFHEPERLVRVTDVRGSFAVDLEVVRAWRARSDLFEDIRAHAGVSFIVTGAGEARSYRAELVEPGFLEFLGVSPAIGRTFSTEEAIPGNDRVVLLTDDAWGEVFRRDPDVLGRTLDLDGEPYTVIGVLPPTLRRLPGGVVSLVVPLTDPTPWGAPQALALGRLAPGLTPELARARIRSAAEVLNREYPGNGGWEVGISPVDRATGVERERGLKALAGGALCLLLIACANGAGLLILRGASRRSDFSLRIALGASRASLVRHVLLQSLILATVAGILGIALGWIAIQGMLSLMPAEFLRFSYTTIALDGRVLVFAGALALATGLLFGTLPALKAGAVHSVRAGRAATSSRGDVRLRAAIQVAQLALAVVLLSGAALFGRSFLTLTSVPLGFEADRLLRLQLFSVNHLRDSPEASQEFARDLDRRLAVLPGVVGVARSSSIRRFDELIQLDGGERKEVSVLTEYHVDPSYFRVMGTAIMEGRGPRDEDVSADLPGVVVDVDLARELWPDGRAVGRRFRFDDGPWMTVVGVSEDTKLEGPSDPHGPFTLFRINTPDRLHSAAIWVRTADDPAAVMPAARRIVRELDPDRPIASLETGRAVLGETVANPRFVAVVTTFFAVVAVSLAAVGVYGLLSFAVTQRRREIGVRMALGATRTTVVTGVVGPGLMLGAAGVAIGLAGAMVLSRLVSALLFRTSPLDPWALGVSAAALLVACAVALIGPARRAASIDPAEALRAE